MTQLLEIRTKIVEIYQKTETYIKLILNAVICFCAFMAIKNSIGYNARFSSTVIILALSVISAFLPSSIVVAIMVVYIALQLYSASLVMAATVLVIAVILFCFFLRFTPEYGHVVIGMPILIGMKIPYVLPICLGLFSTPITIIPVCVGTFGYYFIQGVSKNMVMADQVKGSDNPFQFYVNVLDSVIKNEAMIASMIVLSLVIVVVYIVRNIKMDYSFEIATAAGAGTSMIGFIIMMLKYDIGVGIVSVVFFSILSGVIAYIANFIYRPLFYAGTEQVQFEDDYYYYYVKAVPKIKVAGTKVNVKHVVSRRTSSFDEDFGDELDEVDTNLGAATRNSITGATGRVIAGNPDEEFDEYDVKPARTAVRRTRTTGNMPEGTVRESSVPRTGTGSSSTVRRTGAASRPSGAMSSARPAGTVNSARPSGATNPVRPTGTVRTDGTTVRQPAKPTAKSTVRPSSSANSKSGTTVKRPVTAKKDTNFDYSSDYVRSYDDSDDDF